MKLEEMADFLDGLAGSLEKFLGKSPLADLRTVSGCFRSFSGESVSTFCNFVIQARQGKKNGKQSSSVLDQAKVDEAVAAVQHFLDDRHAHDYPSIQQIVDNIRKLKVPEIKTVGDRIGCASTEKTKAELIGTLHNWLKNIKISADQSSFTLARTMVN